MLVLDFVVNGSDVQRSLGGGGGGGGGCHPYQSYVCDMAGQGADTISDTALKLINIILKFHLILFTYNLLCTCPSVRKFYTEHESYSKFQNDWAT